MDEQEFRNHLYRLSRQHGALVSTFARDPLIDEDIEGYKTGARLANPSPMYRYVFEDGTYLEARDVGKGDEAAYEIHGGTAGLREEKEKPRPAAPRVKLAPTGGNDLASLRQYEQVLVDRYNDEETSPEEQNKILSELNSIRGQMRLLESEKSRKAETESRRGTPGTIVYIPGTRIPKGIYDETGQYRDLSDREARALAAAEGGESLPLPGGGGGGGGGGQVGRTEFESERELRAAQAAKAAADAEETRRKLQPPLAVALDNYLKTLETAAKMLGEGRMPLAEADAVKDLAWENLQAAMKGTTIFQEQKERADRERERGQIGRDLINQRLQSGTSLANTLLGSFTQLAGKIKAPEGGLSFNPFTMAESFTTGMGGGSEVGDLAKVLLGTGGGNGGSAGIDGRAVYEMARRAKAALARPDVQGEEVPGGTVD